MIKSEEDRYNKYSVVLTIKIICPRMGGEEVWKNVDKSMKQIVPKLELMRNLEMVPGFRTVKHIPDDDLVCKSVECTRSDDVHNGRERIVKQHDDHGTAHFELLNAGLWRAG